MYCFFGDDDDDDAADDGDDDDDDDDDDDCYMDCFCGNDETDPSHCVFSLITLITCYIMETTVIT